MPKTSHLIVAPSNLALLDLLQTPIWIFDIQPLRIWWANRAALSLSDTLRPQEAVEGDSTHIWGSFQALEKADLEQLKQGKTIFQKWTFYPQGQAASIRCTLSAIRIESGRTAILIEAIAQEKAIADSIAANAKDRDRLWLGQENHLLEGVAKATNQLLTVTKGHTAIDKALELLGRAAAVDRVYIFEHRIHPLTGKELTSKRWEWLAGGLSAPTESRSLLSLADNDFFTSWYDRLSRGQPLGGLARDFPEPTRETLYRQNIRSILLLPIIIESQFWGGICFEEASRDRVWSSEEKSILMAAVGSIGGAIARQEAEAQLAKLNSQLEQMVSERTLQLKTANEQLLQEIGERTRMEEQLRYNLFHDTLTGLPNRAFFMEKMGQALVRAKQDSDSCFAVLFLDLDRFKVINDSLGHTVGDGLLIEIAYRFLNCLRPEDTICRLGGDEFAILLEDIPEYSYATQVADRIQQNLKHPFIIDGPEIFTSVSIGIVHSLTNYDDPEAILRDAGIVMYRAKTLGRSRHEVFDTAMHDSIVAAIELENDLRRAVKTLEYEQVALPQFQLYYQSIVTLKTGLIAGFEALIRWHHPEKKTLISPVEFIPIAEETGLIVPLGEWILREACRQLRIWQDQFPERRSLTVAVNLSSRQFSQPDLLERVDRILEETGINGRNLKLEITESAIMDNPDVARDMLLQLRARNIQLCMDDFGTGYSSLSYLHRFPLDTLKIDRSFVSRMGSDPENYEIVQTIVNLARNLGMDAIAEGVETTAQLLQLQSLECEFAQGYLFSKPADPPNATQLLLDSWRLPPIN